MTTLLLAGLIIVALAFAAVVAIHAMTTTRSAMRMLDRQAAAAARTQETTLERFAYLVGKNLEPTPREAKQELETDRWQAEREMVMARVIADPEQAIDYPSPGEARFREKQIASRYEFGDLDAEARELLADVHEPVFVDLEVDATV